MKKSILAIAGVVCGVALMFTALPAMAHVDVGIHIGIPGVFVQPAPVYVQPQPVYVESAHSQPVYAEPVYEQRVYVRPRRVYVIENGWREWYGHPRYWHDADFHAHDNRRDHHGGH
jgi:hypothetical protein